MFHSWWHVWVVHILVNFWAKTKNLKFFNIFNLFIFWIKNFLKKFSILEILLKFLIKNKKYQRIIEHFLNVTPKERNWQYYFEVSFFIWITFCNQSWYCCSLLELSWKIMMMIVCAKISFHSLSYETLSLILWLALMGDLRIRLDKGWWEVRRIRKKY